MRRPSGLALAALTHILALSGGWAIYQARASQTKEKPEARLTNGRTKARERSAVAEVDPKAGREILDAALKSMRENTLRNLPGPYDSRASHAIPQTPKEIVDRIDNIAIPADFAKALSELLAKKDKNGGFSAEVHHDLAALVFHWLANDPAACFSWMNADAAHQFALNSIMDLGPELSKRLGAKGVIDIANHAGRMKGQMVGDLARVLAKTGNAAGVSEVKSAIGSDGQSWNFFSRSIGSAWPNDRLDELVKLAVTCDEPQIAIGHRIHGDQGVYIAGLLADESLPEDFRRRISEDQFAREGLARDPKVPLEMRLQNGGNLGQVLRNDVTRLLTEQRDWAFAFRKGEASAQEILDMVSAGTSEIAKTAPDALRDQVFRELAEENPAEAMTLLDGLPPQQRSEQALFISRSHFTDVEPDKFLELLQQIPTDTKAEWEGRLDTWNRRSFTNHERLQDGYVQWVRALPPGLDRDMACYSLARAVAGANPELAASLRTEVSDPDLKQRIAKHR
jgi:hypothetical protein